MSQSNITLKKEKRFSRKIIIGKIKKNLPFLSTPINILRIITAKHKCPTYPISQVYYSDGPWIERGVTRDQQAIEEYLQHKITPKDQLLHVGVGNSHIAKLFSLHSSRIDGITIVKEEKAYADSLSLANYHPYVMNKNDHTSLSKLSGNYRYIIDNDLAAYACCKTHLKEMITRYLLLLSPQGEILTGKISTNYFDSGIPLPQWYLEKLSKSIGFTYTYTNTLIKIKKINDTVL